MHRERALPLAERARTARTARFALCCDERTLRQMAAAILVTRVGGLACAFLIEHVVETMRPMPIEPVGGSDDDALAAVDGLAMIRGLPVPVVDARKLLGA